MEDRQYNYLHATDEELFRGAKWFAQDHIHSKKQYGTSAQILILRQLFFLLQLGWLTKSSITKYKAKWLRCLFSGISMAKYIDLFRLLSVLFFKGQSNFITLSIFVSVSTRFSVLYWKLSVYQIWNKKLVIQWWFSHSLLRRSSRSAHMSKFWLDIWEIQKILHVPLLDSFFSPFPHFNDFFNIY